MFYIPTNFVCVTTAPSATQPSSWQARIVYFDEALIANNAEVMSNFGLSQYFAEPLLDIPHIKITGEAGRIREGALACCIIYIYIYISPFLRLTLLSAAMNGDARECDDMSLDFPVLSVARSDGSVLLALMS